MNHGSNEDPKPEEIRTGIVGFALNNPYFIVVGCLMILIMGMLAMFTVPKDLLPAANLPAVQILSFYTGMPVEYVAEDLSTRFELYTGEAIGIERQESKSLVGVSIVKNFFNSDTDLNAAISQMTSLVLSVLRKLPPGTQPPLILPFDPMATTPLALIAVSGDLPEKTLYDIGTYKVRTAAQAVDGAMAPTVMGGAPRQIVIYVDPKKLKEFNLSPVEVLDKVNALNTFIPTGDIKIGNLDYSILSNGLADTMKAMDDFPLRSEEGVAVYLKQVGEVKDASAIQTNIVMVNGKRQVYVPIFRQPGANSIQVVDDIKKVIKDLQGRIKDVKLELVADQSSFIRHAIDSIAEETMIGGGLAALLVFLFLGNPRASLGLLLTIPLSLLVSFLGLQATKQTFNAMTLGGLALAIGVLVDNSIVVLENISNKIESGMTPPEASYKGAAEVAMPVLASTLATLVVLFPVVFLTGIVKILFGALTKSVMFAMIGSYFAAMTVMPLFASKVLKSHSGENKLPRFFQFMERIVKSVTAHYVSALRWALSNGKKIIFFLILGLVMIGVILAPRIGTELFPRADAGNFMLELRFATGTRIEKTADLATGVEKQLRQWIDAKDLKMIIINAGLIYGFPAAFTPNTGTQDVFFNIELTDDRKHTTQDYAKIIREKLPKAYPGVTFNIELGGLLSSALNGGLPSPIDVQIEGPDPVQSHKIAEDLVEKIKPLKGAVQVRVQQRLDNPQIQVDFDRKKSMAVGVNTEEMVKNIVSAVNGSSSYNTAVWVDPHSGIDYLIGVQFTQDNVSSFDQLKEIPITSKNQKRGIPLSDVATLSQSKGPSEINHVNLRPVMDLYLDAQDRDIGSLSKDVAKVIKGYQMPAGYSAQIRGEILDMNKSVGSLGGGFLLATMLVYLILVVQFKSFGTPLIIMMTVPLGMVGIIIMLFLTHTYFSIQAAIGAIFMIGIAVANGVLLIEFILHKSKDGVSEESIMEGSKARLRPILMTSLASVLGLVPMAIGLGHGSEANIPLGRSVIGGQLLSVTLTLFVIPILVKLFLEKKNKKAETTKVETEKLGPAPGNAVPGILSVLFVIGFLTTDSARANDGTFTPEEVIKLALHYNPAIKGADMNIQAADQVIGVRRANYFPKLELDAIDSTGFPGSTSELGIRGLVGSPFREGLSTGLVMTGIIYDFGRTSSRVSEAKSQYELTKVDQTLTVQDTKQQALHHLILCSYWLTLENDMNGLIEQSVAIENEVKNFVRTGQKSVVESYLVQSQTEEVRTIMADSQSRQQDELRALQIITDTTSSKTCPQMNNLNFTILPTQGVEPPIIKRQASTLKVAEARLDIANADYYPELIGIASIGTLEDTHLLPKQDYSVGVGLRFPIFEGLETMHNVHSARAEVDARSQFLDATKEQFQISDREFIEKIHSAKIRLDHLKLEHELSTKSLALARKRYRLYQGSLFDLRESLRNTLRVLTQENAAKLDLVNAQMEEAVYSGGI